MVITQTQMTVTLVSMILQIVLSTKSPGEISHLLHVSKVNYRYLHVTSFAAVIANMVLKR